MIYKVQFQIHRRGYRKLRLEGLYVPETGSEMSVPEMKRDVTEFIKRQPYICFLCFFNDCKGKAFFVTNK